MAKKNPAAVALGRKGGMAKVKKGIAMFSKADRAKLVKKAAAARWGKKLRPPRNAQRLRWISAPRGRNIEIFHGRRVSDQKLVERALMARDTGQISS